MYIKYYQSSIEMTLSYSPKPVPSEVFIVSVNDINIYSKLKHSELFLTSFFLLCTSNPQQILLTNFTIHVKFYHFSFS